MVDKESIYQELVDAFIQYQYRLDNPMPSTTETKAVMILQYRSDRLFHAKVQRIVAGIMTILEKHLSGSEEG